MIENELSRPVKARSLASEAYIIEASPEERKALAERFALSELQNLRAELSLSADGSDISAAGRLQANWLQACAISGDNFAVGADEPLHFRFVPARGDGTPDEEIELEETDCDEIEFENGNFDLGEAVAQSLGLIIDPYATGPDADQVRKKAGLLDDTASGTLAAALAGLTKD